MYFFIATGTVNQNGVAVAVTGNSNKLSRSDPVEITATATMLSGNGDVTLSISPNEFTYSFAKTSTQYYINESTLYTSERTMSIKQFTLDYNINYVFTVTACAKNSPSLCGVNTFSFAIDMKSVNL